MHTYAPLLSALILCQGVSFSYPLAEPDPLHHILASFFQQDEPILQPLAVRNHLTRISALTI